MNTELSEEVLDEAASRGETLLVADLLRLIERHDTGPGVPDSRLDAYVAALADGRFDEETLRGGLSNRLTESTQWIDEPAVYRLETGYSTFPPVWHDELLGEDDLLQYVATMTAAIAGGSDEYDHGGRGTGVPEKLLCDTAVVFGEYGYRDAQRDVDRLREEGLLSADADQHPSARLQLSPAGADRLGVDPDSGVAVDVDPVAERKKDPRIDE